MLSMWKSTYRRNSNLKALMGEFSLHFPPFMTKVKPGSEFRRTMIDLSQPKGASVNDGVLKNSYLSTDFQLHYPSVDIII